MWKLLFSFKGRVGRKRYWQVGSASIIALFVGLILVDSIPEPGWGWGLVIASLWSFCAIHAKRCHDHEKPGAWSLVPLWNIIALGCLRGTTGPNTYGEDPLTATAPLKPAPNPIKQPKQPPVRPAGVPPKRKPAPPKSIAVKPEKLKKNAAEKAPRKPPRKDSASPPSTVVAVDPNASIQKMVKSAGDSLQIFPPCEFAGPLTIDRSITVDFGNSTLWAIKGPVLTVKGSKVCIRNAHIEVTGSMEGANDDEITAIRVEGRGKVTFENIKVHGRVKGVKGEAGQWKIPRSLSLGTLVAGQSHEFRVHLEVPAECELQAEGPAGLTLYPQRLAVGDQEVILQFAEHLTGHYSAHIMLATRNFKRKIALNACFCGLDMNPAAIKGEGQLIYPAPHTTELKARDNKAEATSPPPEPAPPEPEAKKEKVSVSGPPSPEPHPPARPEPRPPVPAPPPPRRRIVTGPSIPTWAGGSQGSTPISAPDGEPVVSSSPDEKGSQDNPEADESQPTNGPIAPNRDSKRISAKPGKAFDI